MKWWGQATSIEMVDTPEELLIRATRRTRGIDVVAFAAFLACGTAFAIKEAGLARWCAIGVVLWSVIWVWLHRESEGVTSELTVDAKSLSVRSSESSDEVVTVAWSQIGGLEFSHGGEDDPTGLYARRSWSGGICLIPDLTDEQVIELIRAIYTRFPYVETDVERSEVPSIFGRRSEPIKLDLSSKN